MVGVARCRGRAGGRAAMSVGFAVVARKASREFRGRGGAVVLAVDGVSLEVALGSCVALSGPSGSGKSTLLALLSALDRPSAGSVEIAGSDIASASESERARLRGKIGFIFQGAPMIRGLALWENVTQALVPRGVNARERRALARAALVEVGIEALADRRPEDLSGGECQRATVARAVVVSPRLLVADEPTSQLDPESARRVIDAIAGAWRRGTTVLVASHDPALLAIAERTYRMARGRLEA